MHEVMLDSCMDMVGGSCMGRSACVVLVYGHSTGTDPAMSC